MVATTLRSRCCHRFQFVDEATERPRALGEVRGGWGGPPSKHCSQHCQGMRQHHCPERGSRALATPRVSALPQTQSRGLWLQQSAHTVPSQTAQPLTPSFHFSLEKAMAPHSSTLAWKIPWTEEPGRLQSMGSLKVRHDWATLLSLFTFMHWRRKWQPTPVFLPGESQGRGSLVGCTEWDCTSMGLHRVRHDWSDLAPAAAVSWKSNHLLNNLSSHPLWFYKGSFILYKIFLWKHDLFLDNLIVT